MRILVVGIDIVMNEVFVLRRGTRCVRIEMSVNGYEEGSMKTINSREGVIQGDPLAMVCYAISTLPLINELQKIVPNNKIDWHQVWYADDAGIIGKLKDIKLVFDKMIEIWPKYGYHPCPFKSKLIINSNGMTSAISTFKNYNINILYGARYLGSFIGDTNLSNDWIKEKKFKWIYCIKDISKIAKYQPQTAYAGFQRVLQQEWRYLQRNTDTDSEIFQN